METLLAVLGILAAVAAAAWACWEPLVRIWKGWWDAIEARARARKVLAECDYTEERLRDERARREREANENAREARVQKYIRFFTDDLENKRAELRAKGYPANNVHYIEPPKPAPGEDPEEVREAWMRFCNPRYHGG